MLTITTKIISDVVEVMWDIMSGGIRIDWLDRLLREIHEKKKYQELVQQVNTLNAQMKEAEKYFNLTKNQLKQAEEKLKKNTTDPALVANYDIKALRSPRVSK